MLTGKLVVEKDRRYSMRETAKVLGICRSTLDKLVKKGELHPKMHSPTHSLFIEGSEIERFYNCTI